MTPGGVASGNVSVVAGTAPLTLTETPAVDVPGVGGGRLSQLLLLRIDDVTDPATPLMVYFGPLGKLPRTALGAAADGAARTYEFRVGFPNRQATDVDAYMAATASVGFVWDMAGSATVQAASGPACGGRKGDALAVCHVNRTYAAAEARCAARTGSARSRCDRRAKTARRRALARIRCHPSATRSCRPRRG